jgi:hypothetical protein
VTTVDTDDQFNAIEIVRHACADGLDFVGEYFRVIGILAPAASREEASRFLTSQHPDHLNVCVIQYSSTCHS